MSGGLSPVAGEAPTILILGSYPSLLSLQAGEYYANPRNAFWRVMATIFGVPAHLPYGERTAALTARRVSRPRPGPASAFDPVENVGLRAT